MRNKGMKIGAVIVLLLCGFCWWYAADYYHADDVTEYMRSSENVSVRQDGNAVAFVPDEAVQGFIFYPGGKVEHTAYAPLMSKLADHGVLCVLVEMPLNLAVLDIDAADGIRERYPQIKSWYIGGHSLGGSMAASHAVNNASDYDGLVLLASYSAADLSNTDLEVLSIYGSKDGVLSAEKYAENKVNLPASFEEHVIKGGCHAGFGSYGAQAGDGVPEISGEEQMEETVRLLMDFFMCARSLAEC